jgi:hypothetical protein
LPISGLFGLIFPNLQGYAEWILYPGGMTLLLAILGLTWKGNKKEIFFWLGVFLICLLLALGPVIPVLSWFFSLPGLNQLRVPARSLFLCGLALSILAAYGMETLLSIDLLNVKNQKRFSVSSGLFVVITFVDLAAAGLCWINGKVILDFIWGAVTISLAGLLYLSVKKQWIGRTYWPFLMIGLCVFDLAGVDVSHIVFKDPISLIAERQDVISTLSKDTVAFRTYSPSYSIPQQTAAAAQLEMTDGIDPIQLKSYVDFMEKASGIGQTGYSVTMPPLVGDNPHQSNQKAVPDAGLLGLLNVRYIVSDFPIQADGLGIFKQENGVWVYTNQMGLPRVWVQEANAVIGTKIINEPSLRWTPNLIQIDAHGPGLLVLSELNYPGWLVRVDGKKGDLIPVNGLLRGVKIPEGEHQVVFEFAPVSVGIGLVCALFGWILFFIVEAISRRK